MQNNNGTVNISGWGVDADPKRRPYYPIHQSPPNGTGAHWKTPEQQPRTVEILTSNEYNKMPAVFGTSVPPSRLSGVLRRIAFKYSESSFGHWLPLLLADRINFFEGLFVDLFKGHVPRLIGDGLKADFVYNRKKFLWRVTKIALVTSAPIVLYKYFQRKETSK